MIDYDLRQQHDEWGNNPALLSAEDRSAIDLGAWKRAGHETLCETCDRPYWKHPEVIGALWLHRLCDNTLVKL
ncbi:hypothetical protein HOU03_gp099 [Caulobacter phage CcrSC]|uniref:Uncharacterized protein n=1 Tax=Caulobacter phage CcrSC TaxID=2283272 RepID=A0A385ECT3_9CAUD|nr:hypothetical protein HOU03_gp099 [Caulobacter phage CcrSC]AXQ69681.1 hypothetical protein CcrSC_gp099 [Caulobacter phage CcrSC]